MPKRKRVNPKNLRYYWYEFADSYKILTLRMMGEEYYKYVKLHGKLVAVRDADVG